MRGVLLVTLVFAIAAVALSGTLPLWLDEILQLMTVDDGTTAEMIQDLPLQPGASPLGYLVHRAVLPLTGTGSTGARIPALIFGIASVFAVGLVALELDVTHAWLAALIFASFPQTLRYTTEARIYSQALFLSILATGLYLRLVKRTNFPNGFAFALVLIAAVYTMPYTLFVGVALVSWSMWNRDWRTAIHGGAALIVAGGAFLPWYLWSKSMWAHDIAREGWHFTAAPKTLLLIFREVTGAGYFGSALLLILCALALLAPALSKSTRVLLAFLIAIPLIGGLLGDFTAGYFAAARQFLWILPAAAILASSISTRQVEIAFAAVLIGIGGVQSYKYFTAPHENWSAAADALVLKSQQGQCVQVVPPENLRLYRFFRSELRETNCQSDRIALVITPATSNQQRDQALTRMLESGYVKTAATFSGMSTIYDFQSRSAMH
jgi:4-amino-4-deoxy-L-arabinose transferase-like glycosyltransferase